MLKSQALEILNEKIAKCELCTELVEQRKQNNGKTVPGSGNPNARIMIIGEAPGKDEEASGLPFVGRAGKLLTNILAAAGWDRNDLFICNTVKCRPPGNRDPKPEEAQNCRKFLDLQIKCIQPEWIICLGRIASIYLLNQDLDTTMGSMRGEIYDYNGIKVICTYHPSFLLRSPAAKEDVWNDIKPVISALQSKVSTV